MDKIRVGIIGTGGWTKYGHLPALKSLPAFDVVAIAGRRKEAAETLAEQFAVPNAFGDEQEIIHRSDIDLVVVLTPALDHARLAKLVIAAGKDVYSEWPLSTTTTESEELAAFADLKGVRHVVGLQRRFGPSSRYLQDLIKQKYVGEMRSASMTVNVDAFGASMPEIHSWSFDISNFANALSVYGGHFGDVFFHAVGFPKQLTAVVKNQFPIITAPESGRTFPTTRPDAAMAIGILENGALFSLQIEGGQNHRTGLQIDVTGTEGVLRVSNVLAFQNKDDNLIEGMKGQSQSFGVLPVPPEYQSLADTGLDVSQQDVAYLYAAYAHDRKHGTTTATNFGDAVKQHRLIDEMFRTSTLVFGRAATMNDQECILYAIREAQLILAQHIEPGPHDADETINDLLAVLDRNEVVESVDRLEVELGLRFP